MPRPKAFHANQISKIALPIFWNRGFGNVSIDDLVRLSGVSRHVLYSEIGGKQALYLSVFDTYQQDVVTPAFARVEHEGGLDSIAAYFEHQIAIATENGLPGPGCLVGNAATETAPHHPEVASLVRRHNDRLTEGFVRTLSSDASPRIASTEIERLAEFLTISSQGLWAMSRIVDDPAPLRTFAYTLLDLIRQRIV